MVTVRKTKYGKIPIRKKFIQKFNCEDVYKTIRTYAFKFHTLGKFVFL